MKLINRFLDVLFNNDDNMGRVINMRSMTIYVYRPSKLLLKKEFSSLSFKKKISHDLAPYYGNFDTSDIKLYSFKDDRIDTFYFYIMEDALKPNSYEDILQVIKNIIGEFANNNVEIKLDYNKINPDFDPLKGIVQSNHGKINTKVSEKKEYSNTDIVQMYPAVQSNISWERLILQKEVLHQIEEAIAVIEVEHEVFEKWGLKKVASPISAISFFGEPGTGKTLAANAIANRVHKKIIKTSYAEIDNELVSKGPRNVQSLFKAAKLQNAVLFIDEADSLLSRRLANADSGALQGANALRSEMMIQIEAFKGIVIFATNLVKSYDIAFISRLISIEIPMPGFDERKAIWDLHLGNDESHKMNIPLADDVDTAELASIYEFSGRDIRNAVKDACITVAMNNRRNNIQKSVSQTDLRKACEKISNSIRYFHNDTDIICDKVASDNKLRSKDTEEELKSTFQNSKF